MSSDLHQEALWLALQCPCGCAGIPEDTRVEQALRETLAWLGEVSRALGGLPILVLAGGGYRCAAYAVEVDEPAGELHRTGRAVDFCIRDLAPSVVQRTLVSAHYPRLVPEIVSFGGYTHAARREGQPRRLKGADLLTRVAGRDP
jgi:hypothetical protein